MKKTITEEDVVEILLTMNPFSPTLTEDIIKAFEIDIKDPESNAALVQLLVMFADEREKAIEHEKIIFQLKIDLENQREMEDTLRKAYE